MSDDESTNQNTMVCPFCDGNGEVDAVEQRIIEREAERSVSWALDLRTRVLDEVKAMGISQDVFACASLGNRQSHLSQILRQALSRRPDKHRMEEMLQMDTFLRLPARCRRDIYEHVADDPNLFVRFARFHARLLREDAALPGVSQLARAVLDRFASELTLYPSARQVAVLAGALNLSPALIRSYLDRLCLKLTSPPHASEFKLPKPRRHARPLRAARRGPVQIRTVTEEDGTEQILPAACLVGLAAQPEAPAPCEEPRRPASVSEWAWPCLSSSPKAERAPDGLEADDSFVRGLLASPGSRHSASPDDSVFCPTLDTPVRRHDLSGD